MTAAARADLVRALVDLAGAFPSEAPSELQVALLSVLVRAVVLERAEARGLVTASGDARTSWSAFVANLSRLATGANARGLFDPARDERLRAAEVSTARLSRLLGQVRAFSDAWRSRGADDPEIVGAAFEGFLDVELVRDGGRLSIRESLARRRLGAHYTSRALTEQLVRRALAPLLANATAPDAILAFRVCDPAMGGGAFLVEATRQLSAAAPPGTARAVATRCVYGVDRNPLAVDVARLALWLAVDDPTLEPSAFADCLRAGDALVSDASFEWERSFADVLERGGFDAMIGNPPWVSYAGRAAQPLSSKRRAAFLKSPAFGGYRNLQALFVHRAATLLRAGGRLGFVLPTSMSDLDGYRISRKSHDELCDVDAELPDFGDSFDGVFQPCMGLLSTRRTSPIEASGAPWPLAREGLDSETGAFLERLAALPRFAASTFGERGFQTNRGDVKRLREPSRLKPKHTVALRTGTEVAAFERKPASLYADPGDFGTRLRPPSDWQAVTLLIRQTARFPMVALSDGLAFRNSVLAGFADPKWSAHFLVAYLNSGPVRFYHYMRHRDARQGMPQMKIGHLRALPAPTAPSEATRSLEALGQRLGERNEGLTPSEREELDRVSADVLELSDGERARVEAFVRTVKG